MKKLLFLMLSIIMILTLCACDVIVTDVAEVLKHFEKAPFPDEELLNGEMRVTFLDVGQGDCSFVELADGRTILIDAGEAENAPKIKKYIKGLGYDTLDFVIATHPHADHIGALAEVIEDFEVGKIYMPKAVTTTRTYEKLLETIQGKGLKITAAKAGVTMLDEEKLWAEFVAPVKDKYDDLNNYSAVLKLTYKNISFLFTGDAEKESEKQISADVNADILKLGHHGSSTSSSMSFLKKVSPQIAIISCGEDNEYGHPHNEVISRLEKQNIEYCRTDEKGSIAITTDGEVYDIAFEKD